MPGIEGSEVVKSDSFDLWEDKLRNPFTLTYSFLNALPDYIGSSLLFNKLDISEINGDPAFDQNSFTPLSNVQKSTINSLLAASSNLSFNASFSDVLNNFAFQRVEQTTNGTEGTGDIVFGLASKLPDAPDILRAGNFSETDVSDGSFIIDKSSIFLNSNNLALNDPANFDEGELGRHVLLHELAHSLGLDDYSTDDATSYLNNMKYSVMSYVDFNGLYATDLQLLDIAALQNLYGRNYDMRATETAYGKDNVLFNPDAPSGAVLYSIWDGGGIDTIDASGFSKQVQIDLRQGHFSSIGFYNTGDPVLFDSNFPLETQRFDPISNINVPDNNDHGNISISFYTVIENAKGTDDSLGDILIGNAWNNELRSGKGNDALYGDGVVYGQIITPDDASDDDAGFLGIDVNGDGSLYVDPYRAWTAADGASPQYAKDLSGNDILYGDEGDDRLYGGNGDDRLYGGDDDDYLAPGHGNDIIDGGAGINTLTYADLRGSVYWDAVFEYRPLQLIIDTRMDDQGYGHTYDMFGDMDSWKNIQKIELGVMNTQVIGSDEGSYDFISHPSWMASMDLDYSGLADGDVGCIKY